MKISVITVAYKNSKVVIDLLNSIAKYNDIGDELEVIIVDNSPEDVRIEEAIKVADYKNYIYIKADNRGFGAGNNRGAEIAKGEILAFLNPDIILIEPIFKKICNKFAEDGKLVWIGGRLLNKSGGHNYSYGYTFGHSETAVESLAHRYFNLFDSKKMFLAGADIIMRKDIFKRIGMFDENIFMYHEEADLTQRILRLEKDYNIKFCPDVRMIHLEGKSTYYSDKTYQIYLESAIYYATKYNIHHKAVTDFYHEEYCKNKKRIILDKIFRPEVAKKRIIMLKILEQKFPKFINK